MEFNGVLKTLDSPDLVVLHRRAQAELCTSFAAACVDGTTRVFHVRRVKADGYWRLWNGQAVMDMTNLGGDLIILASHDLESLYVVDFLGLRALQPRPGCHSALQGGPFKLEDIEKEFTVAIGQRRPIAVQLDAGGLFAALAAGDADEHRRIADQILAQICEALVNKNANLTGQLPRGRPAVMSQALATAALVDVSDLPTGALTPESTAAYLAARLDMASPLGDLIRELHPLSLEEEQQASGRASGSAPPPLKLGSASRDLAAAAAVVDAEPGEGTAVITYFSLLANMAVGGVNAPAAVKVAREFLAAAPQEGSNAFKLLNAITGRRRTAKTQRQSTPPKRVTRAHK